VTDDKPTAAGYAADSAVAAYFGVHPKSIARWDRNPKLGFPPSIRINGRKFRKWADIRDFERRAAAAHAASSPRDRPRKTS
jgi:hypothetical protein